MPTGYVASNSANAGARVRRRDGKYAETTRFRIPAKSTPQTPASSIAAPRERTGAETGASVSRAI